VARLTIRIDLTGGAALGPGKVRLRAQVSAQTTGIINN
jgi:hypothetical protein